MKNRHEGDRHLRGGLMVTWAENAHLDNLSAVPVGQAGIKGGDERILVHVTADDA